MPRESAYQAGLILRIQEMYPSAIILRNDPRQNQGIPDLLILIGPFWAMLEVKRSASEPVQPNQPYFVDLLNRMSFAAFIYPEIEEQVLDELQSTLSSRW